MKVQYPGVGDAIAADLRNADLLGALLRQGFGGLDPDDMVAEIKERITGELDYRLEASNQMRFADHYRGHPFIHVPDVLPTLSTGRVLTTELVTGATWAEALTWDQQQRDQIGECLFRFVFRSLYGMHLFNGDPHPGNYLFHGDGKVTFLDFGLVKRLRRHRDGDVHLDGAHRRVRTRRRRRSARRSSAPACCAPGAPVDDQTVGEYFSQFYESVRDDATITWSGEYASRIVRHTFDRTQPDLAVRHGAARVRLHPTHQPRAVRTAGRAARHRQLPADGRGAVAVRARPAQHADGATEQAWLARVELIRR